MVARFETTKVQNLRHISKSRQLFIIFRLFFIRKNIYQPPGRPPPPGCPPPPSLETLPTVVTTDERVAAASVVGEESMPALVKLWNKTASDAVLAV